MGNLLVLTEFSSRGFATLDISDPVNPVLIQTIDGASGYSHFFTAGLLLTSGGFLDSSRMYVHRVGHDGRMSYFGEAGENLAEGGYGSYQDGYFFGGFSQQVAKFTIDPPKLIGEGTSGILDRDEDFAQPLGNVVLASDDHGKGSALMPHQTAPDTTGAEVVWMHPPAGATGVAVTSRIGVSMSDQVAVESLIPANFRVTGPGDAVVSGQLSAAQNNVNFVPDEALEAGTVYDVEVCSLRDLVGNAGGCVTWTFTTKAGGADTAGVPSCRLDRFQPVETGSAKSYAPVAVENAPTAYTWDFGNGGTVGPQAAAEATFTYSAPGRFPVTLTVTNAQGTSRCGAVQIAHTPVTAKAPVSSSSIVSQLTVIEIWEHFEEVDVYVANPDNDTVTRINDDNTVVWQTAVGDNPRTLAIAPNRQIWVANQGSGNISVLNRDGVVVQTIDLDYGAAPYGIVFAPDGLAAYVTLSGKGRLLKLNLNGAIVGDLAVGARPRGIAVSGDSKRILVTRFVSAFAETGAVGEVYEIDAATFSVTRTIELAFDPGPDTESTGRGVPNYLSSVVISPDGKTAWIPSKKDNIARGNYRDGEDLTFETQTRAIVSQIALTTNAEVLSKRIDFAIAAEEDGAGLGRIRMRRIRRASKHQLHGFIQEAVEPDSTIHTDGWEGYVGLEALGYRHEYDFLATSSQSASELLPRVHRVAALLKRWLIGTHQGAVSREHLDYYLDEYTFRFNRRRSRHRGKLFYRLVQQAAAVGPTTYSEMVQHVRGRRISRPQDMG